MSRTVPMVVCEAEISLLACQLLLGQGALALKVGGKRAGRDELKCSAAEALREIRRARRGSQAGAAEESCQAVATDRTRSTGANRSQDEEENHRGGKKHVAPQPPRLKVLSAEQKRQIEDSNLKEAVA